MRIISKVVLLIAFCFNQQGWAAGKPAIADVIAKLKEIEASEKGPEFSGDPNSEFMQWFQGILVRKDEHEQVSFEFWKLMVDRRAKKDQSDSLDIMRLILGERVHEVQVASLAQLAGSSKIDQKELTDLIFKIIGRGALEREAFSSLFSNRDSYDHEKFPDNVTKLLIERELVQAGSIRSFFEQIKVGLAEAAGDKYRTSLLETEFRGVQVRLAREVLMSQPSLKTTLVLLFNDLREWAPEEHKKALYSDMVRLSTPETYDLMQKMVRDNRIAADTPNKRWDAWVDSFDFDKNPERRNEKALRYLRLKARKGLKERESWAGINAAAGRLREALMRANTPEHFYRTEADAAIVKQVHDFVLAAGTSENDAIRANLGDLLKTRGIFTDDEVLPVLRRLLEDHNANVRWNVGHVIYYRGMTSEEAMLLAKRASIDVDESVARQGADAIQAIKRIRARAPRCKDLLQSAN